MSTEAMKIRAVPGTVDVCLAQARRMARAQWLAAVAMAAGIAIGVGVLTWMGSTGAWGRSSLAQAVGRLHGALQVVAFLWPMMVTWRDEAPSRRTYHWSQPVQRMRHQLVRTAVGGAALAAALAAGGLAGWIVGALVQGGMASGGGEVFVASAGSLGLAYLLGSVPALLSDHAVLWLIGAYAASALLMTAWPALGWPGAHFLEAAVTHGRWSLGRALGAPAILSGAFGQGTATEHPEPWSALAVWLAVAAAGVIVAVSVRQERSGAT
ncbi:MAG TPA: hypothetical protein VKB18_11355 [Gemmatimonadota bacterium]|nr:hypothetical protein [Gemmatimonadota bacterium]